MTTSRRILTDSYAHISRTTSSNLTHEQRTLLNYDEFLALWYLTLASWYAFLAFRNWKRRLIYRQRQYEHVHATASASEIVNFLAIHWFILSVSIMGLANFLFSFSLLEVLDHRSVIGSSVKKLSYANMILACLRHPCVLSLGVLAPKMAFVDSTAVPWLGSVGIRMPSGMKRTAMSLATLTIADVIVRLTENLLILFRYGRRDASSTRLADFFEFVLDGVFLAWMVLNLSGVTHQISRDHGGRITWWNTPKLISFWVLYGIFVLVAAIESILGFIHYVINVTSISAYIIHEVNGINELVLLSGIAILLRPTRNQSEYSLFNDFTRSFGTEALAIDWRVDDATHNTTDYVLLLPRSREGSHQNDNAESLEMTMGIATEPASDSLRQP